MDDRDFFGLPQHVVMNIFSFLPEEPFAQATSTCHSYHASPSLTPLWQNHFNELTYTYKLKRIEYNENWHRDPNYYDFSPKLQTTTPKKLFLLKKAIPKTADFTPLQSTINIDFGSYTFKAGFGGDEFPKHMVPAICGSSKRM
jgi:hypothetical protein